MLLQMDKEKFAYTLEGDQLTPVSVFQKISGKKKFLLESSLKHEAAGRYSFIGSDPILEFISEGMKTTLQFRNGKSETKRGNPIEILKEFIQTIPSTIQAFPFEAGGIGYLGYDVIRAFENIGGIYEDELEMPDMHLMFYEEVIVYDHLEQKVYITGHPLTKNSVSQELHERMKKKAEEILAAPSDIESKPLKTPVFEPKITKDEFVERVKKAKEYILDGDIFQIVLSQRMKGSFTGEPFDLYRKLRIQNPSPYMYFIDFGEYSVAGTSPESLIKVTGRDAYTNPIAGTKRRGKTKQEDDELEEELKNDHKELAEHRMLVDLGRNDLGKVCEFGSVELSKYMEIEKYKHVIHLVSEVCGHLRENQSSLDALTSCLPAGTVSGAPKIRAMQLLNEMESQKRGVYGGAIGYISANADLDFALAIRTMIMKSGTAYIQAGAGIVHDSIPDSEYEETINKLKGLMGVKA